MKFLTRKGFLIEEQGMTYLADTDLDLTLGPLRAAACTYRIALGPRAGQKVLSLQTVPTAPPTLGLCANEQGFSLHAEVCCAAHQRPSEEETRTPVPLHHPPRQPRTGMLDSSRAQQYYAS